MRARSGMCAAVVAVTVVMASGCGASAPKTSASELFQEYTRSTDVKNDMFASGSATSADRVANFASRGSPDQVQTALLSAYRCDTDADCSPSGKVDHAVRDFAGKGGTLFARSILVKHDNGSLELITLYVARRSDKATALIDSHGRSYTGGLDDFRRHNDLLGADDVILTPLRITSVPGEGRIVAVSGHTATDWRPWLIGAGVLGALLVVARRLVLRRRGPDHPDAGPLSVRPADSPVTDLS
ncbi:hypothetical protein [Streptomyces sp. NPDC094437]|uniref:hypothetical protein n=1 Tax=Streptomyces sp. NPDC094437 TaxID=3366060 RepID=UPI0038191B72